MLEENKDIEISILIDFYGEALKCKQLEIMDCYYNQDLSLSEIADNIEITRQGVQDSIKRSKTFLYDMEKKLGYVKHFEELEHKAMKINELVSKIKLENSKIGNVNIDKCANEIVKLSSSLCD